MLTSHPLIAIASLTILVTGGCADSPPLVTPGNDVTDLSSNGPWFHSDAISDASSEPTDTASPQQPESAPSSETFVSDAALPAPDDSGPVPDIVEPPDPEPMEQLNVGWIGGPCVSDADCDYEGGFCLPDGAGFPNGHCTMPCELYCPDAAGMVTTFCLANEDLGAMDEAPGLCAMRCQFSPESPNGCRDGYQCVNLPRHDDPGTWKHTCIPGQGDGVQLTECQEAMLVRGMTFSLAEDPMDHPSGFPQLTCHVEDPVRVHPVMTGVTWAFGDIGDAPTPMFASCPLALALDETSSLLAGQGVTDIIHWGIYNCRVISNTTTLSQHGLANAVDIAMVQMDDGAVYTVLGDWEVGVAMPVTEGGSFLSWVAGSLHEQQVYNIILTPEYNAAHADHFHCDLTPGANSLH